ncbi:hypothetical protein FJY70_04730, partial [candidate division WOR-3 bacterium]|nr:hypothetical protein [candidate division WOR-3 bacterium]
MRRMWTSIAWLSAAMSFVAAQSRLDGPTTEGGASLQGARLNASTDVAPLPAGCVTVDLPPAFGTVIQQWQLEMSGRYSGVGITWRSDSDRFYLCDQLGGLVWSCDPLDPRSTLRRENWVLPNLGTAAADMPLGIAWDSDSGCFWISNLVDGNVNGGCYYVRIRRTALGDTWRWFSENPGDTWLVGDSEGGGAGNMYWMAGSEKWLDRGYFACAPVAPPRSTNNYVWKFNPYTKTSLGRCDTGSLTSERGCGLVPWDSNYILTTGWNTNLHCLRDSNGVVIRGAAATVYGPADLSVWAPRRFRPDDTVFMYVMCSDPNNTLQKISVGMLWSQLPSASPFNVRPLAILAPSQAVDSGQTVVPRLVIRSTGEEPADGVNAYFTIDADGVRVYADSITGLLLNPRVNETLALSNWTPHRRDSMAVKAWTYWAGDSVLQDDTVRNRFLVRVRDIAVTEITVPVPDTVLDSGVVFAPECRVWNYGNVAVNFDLRFRIDDYEATRNVNLIPRGSKLVAAPTLYTTKPGTWTCEATAVVTGDLHPENNTKVDTFYVVTTGVADRSFTGGRGLLSSTSFIVSPNPCRDFALLSFTGPLDHMTTEPLSLSLYSASGRLVL